MKQNPITENSSKLDLRTESNSIRRTLGRKYIVNSKVQTIFIGYGLAMGGLFLAIGFLISITFQRFLLLQSVGGELMTGLDIWILVIFLALLASLILFGVVVSNRVVGPIYRLVKEMEAFNETGEARELRFREKDHFKEVALAYNKIVERLSPKI